MLTTTDRAAVDVQGVGPIGKLVVVDTIVVASVTNPISRSGTITIETMRPHFPT